LLGTGILKDEASGYEGFVLRFQVRADFLRGYDVRVVGDSSHREYWIPAESLEELNRNILGPIEVIRAFRREA